MLMFHCYVEVREHSHVAQLYRLLLGELLAVHLPVFLDIEQRCLDRFDCLIVHRQLTQYHTLVDISRRDGLESILVVLFEESLFNLEGHLHRFERIFELLVDFVDAAEVVKAQHPQLQHFLWWMHQSPHRLEHEYVNALRNEVKFVTELHAGIVHDSDVEFLHKRS